MIPSRPVADDAPVAGRAMLASWYDEHFVDLARLAALACGDLAVAEDAVQDVFAGMYPKPPVLRDPTNPLPYLRTAVLNRCRSTMRRRATGERATLRLVGHTETAADDVEREAVATSTSRDVLAAVRSLPFRQRDVILLRHWVGLSESEIADTLGVSTGTVKSAASRARSTLAPILEALR